MQRVYIAYDPVHGNMLKAYLDSYGIDAQVRGERTYTLYGGVPLVHPSVWVRDEDLAEAREPVEQRLPTLSVRESRSLGRLQPSTGRPASAPGARRAIPPEKQVARSAKQA